MATKIKNQITAAFKMHGLTLRSEASRYLVEVLQPVNEVHREAWLDKIIESVQKQQLHTAMVDRATCEAAVQECNAEQEEESENVFSVIDAFSVPRFTYSASRKKFLPSSSLGVPEPKLHGGAHTKSQLFQNRFSTLHQRTSRHELFTPPVLGGAQEQQARKFQLHPIEFLLGSSSKLGDVIVLGMLAQIKEGSWFLEDNTGSVQVDLSKTNFHLGLFTDHCFVLAEGWYEDQVFHVNALGFPPPEKAESSRVYFGNINFFGGPSALCAKASSRLQQQEQDNQDAMFVFISDVWLDHVKVMEKLRVLFTGYAEFPPTCFVLCGNFLSNPTGAKRARRLKEGLRDLAELIQEHPSLQANCRFVFVPGPQDPSAAHILPRPPITNCITEEFTKKVPSAVFTTNPCRIQYCTQEIVVFREDIVMKMCRNCVKFPNDGDIPTHFSKTIVCQGHLCPTPLHVTPVYWAYDHALQLYPLPDLVVCADKYDPFTSSQAGCTVVNPGSFPRSDFAFKVYMPATRQVEDSKISD